MNEWYKTLEASNQKVFDEGMFTVLNRNLTTEDYSKIRILPLENGTMKVYFDEVFVGVFSPNSIIKTESTFDVYNKIKE